MRKSSDQDIDRGPLLGALLRLAHQSLIGSIAAGVSEAGFSDIQSAHFAAMQVLWDYPKGCRLTEMARQAKITKQSMSELVDHLVLHNYAGRVIDPKDGRARLIKLTSRGRKAASLARSLVRKVEEEWSQRSGAKKIKQLKETLKMLIE